MKKIVKILVYIIFCKFVKRVKYINRDYEKNLDSCIICPNHSNWMDPVYIFPVTKNINIMAKAELFKNKLLGSIFKYFGIFPIQRGSKDAGSIMHAIKLLNSDKINKLLMFPEGTRVKVPKEKPAKIGAVYIAIKSGVPIVPVHIISKSGFFSRVKVIYGEPIYLDNTKEDDKEYIRKNSDELLNKIYNLE